MSEQALQTVAFVDLAGFTALTEAHGDEVAADVAERLSDRALSVLGPTDRLVKAIGDAVMLTAPDPWSGIELVNRLLDGCYTTTGCPLARAGIHHGPVVARGTDLFGNSVNLAARITGRATGGQVLCTTTVADAARHGGVNVNNLGSFALRNLTEPVELFELLPHAPMVAGAVDPVCRMYVQHANAAGRLRYDGTNYWFCSLSCATAFAAHPGRYATGNPVSVPR